MNRPRRVLACSLAAVALAGLAIASLGVMQFSRARNANLTVRALAAGHDMPVAMSAPPLVVLARARLLADKGELPSAQALADELANAPASIEAPLHYALGNAYMRVALARMRKAPFWKVKPIFAVAKSEYRLAIQLDAGNWDARYNYAVASMFLRDSEQAQPTIGTGMAHERAAWPDIPGAPNGMP